MLPEAGVAVTVLTNGGRAGLLFRDIVGHVLRELAGRDLPDEPVPPSEPSAIDAAPYVGDYACDMATITISQEADGRIWLDSTPTDELSLELGYEPEHWELVHYAGDTLVTRERDAGLHRLYAFLDDSGSGRAQYVHYGRAMARA
jgi:hypothetical protein